MSSDKSKVFQEGDVIRLVTKPAPEGTMELNPADFASAMAAARQRAADSWAARENSALSVYQYECLLSTVKNIEFQCDKLRKQLLKSTIRKAPWYAVLMFWRK